ncbi:MAG TPA: hypothetical protein VGA67_01790 [Candidatus Dojkabacteria bacterium]
MRKQMLKNIEYSDALKAKLSISADESTLFAEIKYDDGDKKATCEKSFKNNVMGLKDMDIFIEKMTNNNGILDYFKLRSENA